MKKLLTIISVFGLTICLWSTSCKKLIEVGTPINQLTTDKVFADSTSAEAALVSNYAILNVYADSYNINASIYTDELSYTGSSLDLIGFQQNKIAPNNPLNFSPWKYFYQVAYNANDIIEQLAQSKLPSRTKATFTNEAKFLRAYAYFYLLNLYGHVPLLTTTNVDVNKTASQAAQLDIYIQIIKDLTDAKNGLSASYRGSGKVRANKWAAAAMLAKAYLFKGDWQNAEAQATEVIGSGLYTPLQAPATVFLANSQETILSVYTVDGSIYNGSTFIPSTNSGVLTYPVTNDLLNAFETGDLRKTSWFRSYVYLGITYTYPYKYHNRSVNTGAPENLILLRAGELYLIRAEALARQNSTLPAAIADINVVRQRAGLATLPTTMDQASIFNAINHERQVELFTENGSRFLYLKSSGKIDQVLSSAKTGWSSTAFLWPIPQNDITYNVNLVQNPGY